MAYQGGKTRLTKYILPIILKDRKPDQCYAEPFCGGLGSFSEVHGKRIGGDINKYVIALWNGVKNGMRARTKITKELFDQAKEDFTNGTNKHLSDFSIGWIGMVNSFRGAFFSGRCGTEKVSGRNRTMENVRFIRRQRKNLNQDVEFYHCSYDELPIPENSIIYCDPPYANTTGYKANKEEQFDHSKFWEWCRDMSKKGHKVFVSEYNAPDDFLCIWSMKLGTRLGYASEKKESIERLFVYKHTWNEKPKIKIDKLF